MNETLTEMARLSIAFVAGALAVLALPDDPRRDPVTMARESALRPCFANTTDVSLHGAFLRWEDEYRQQSGKAFQPLWPTIADGPYAGEQIPPYCFAVEGFAHEVTFWHRPFAGEERLDGIPAWNPYPEEE